MAIQRLATTTRQYDTIDLTNYCHMATIMVQSYQSLPYGNERIPNDGRRSSQIAQRAWMESSQETQKGTRLLLCSEVEKGRSVYHLSSQVVHDNGAGSTYKDQARAKRKASVEKLAYKTDDPPRADNHERGP